MILDFAAERIPVFLGAADTKGTANQGPMAAVLARYLAAVAAESVVGFLRRKLGADHFAEASERIKHPEDVLVAVQIEDDPPPSVKDLLARTADLLKRADAGYGAIGSGRVQTNPERRLLFVLGNKFSPVMAKPEGAVYERGFMERPRVVVNRRHPHFRRMLALYETSPPMAAFCLAKSLLLEEDRLREFDSKMIEAATAHARPR